MGRREFLPIRLLAAPKEAFSEDRSRCWPSSKGRASAAFETAFHRHLPSAMVTVQAHHNRLRVQVVTGDFPGSPVSFSDSHLISGRINKESRRSQ